MSSDTALTPSDAPVAPCQKLLILGGGELGRELVICARRLGVHVTVAARYAHSPGAQLADDYHVLNMTQHEALTDLIAHVQPDLIIPEIEAIDIDALIDAEARGVQVVPSARAVAVCMNRRELRTLAADQLGLLTSRYAFAYSADELFEFARTFGSVCHVKPLQSSSGKGQSTLPIKPTRMDAALAWKEAHAHAHHAHDHVMIEAHVHFEQEITLLTIATSKGVFFCDPIGHTQHQGDYVCSWQPAQVSSTQLDTMQCMARELVEELGGLGLFGVEFFISAGQVYFSEASPRPHDTGFVTLATQDVDEFAAHLLAATRRLNRAPHRHTIGASGALLARAHHIHPTYVLPRHMHLDEVEVHIFGKPEAHPGRRMGVILTRADSIEAAQSRIRTTQQAIEIKNT